ncbi:MAG: hypothetical protein KatS3mg036_0108 [Ignavibacterium sp.]|nr:MAG: hypothetical protein KatS3mg036_0108 [Ignavibacterium sp.]
MVMKIQHLDKQHYLKIQQAMTIQPLVFWHYRRIPLGFQNTAVGVNAGSNVTTGSNLTLIGYNAQPSSQSATNQITLGNNQITSLRCNVTSISSLSDVRDKKNIKDLSLGLDFLMNVKPREFNWDKRRMVRIRY